MPVVAVIGGERLLVSGGGDGCVHAFKVRTGEKVWSYIFGTADVNCSPVVSGRYTSTSANCARTPNVAATDPPTRFKQAKDQPISTPSAPRVVNLALRPRNRPAVLAGEGEVVQIQSTQGRAVLRGSEAVRPFRGRMVARRSDPSLGSAGLSRTSRSTSSRLAALPAFRRVASSAKDHWIDYEMFSNTLPDQYFPKGSNWMMLRTLRAASYAAGRGAYLAASIAAASASASISIRATG